MGTGDDAALAPQGPSTGVIRCGERQEALVSGRTPGPLISSIGAERVLACDCMTIVTGLVS